ncbi:MAG: SRPBCC domain-containing protein [Planctomycetota bacterium]
MADSRSVETTFRIAASPEDVFRALTEASELTNWFPTIAESDPQKGGVVSMSWGENWASGDGVFTEFDPPHRVCIRHEGAFGAFPTVQEWTITQDGGETVLDLVHSGFSAGADGDEDYDSVRTGWAFELAGLKHYLERHKGTKREVIVRHLPIGCSQAEACHALLGGTPPAVGEPFSLALPGYGTLEGTVRVNNAPRDFAAIIPGVNHAYFRCIAEACGGPMAATLWLSCYGVDQHTMSAISGGFERLLADKLESVAAE